MTSYSVQRDMDADPERIWGLLTDSSGYPAWNPAVLGIEGDIALGERIRLTSSVNPDRAFKLNVTRFDPPRTMVWADGMPFGLFKGIRTYQLEPKADGVTRFSMEEVFSGPLESLIAKTIPDMTESFELFADGLKKAAEQG